MLASAWLPPAGEERQDAVLVRQVPPPPYVELPMSAESVLKFIHVFLGRSMQCVFGLLLALDLLIFGTYSVLKF